jgi:two-component system chemotaxis sensor kinase CheA
MSDPNQAFRERLQAIFADEARSHLAEIEVGLLALEQGTAAGRAGNLEQVLKALHTLKGAARAVDRDHLERLCHALESACAATQRTPQAPAASDLDLLLRGVGLARDLAGKAAGRTVNQAGALIKQLERLAGRTGAPAGALEDNAQAEVPESVVLPSQADAAKAGPGGMRPPAVEPHPETAPYAAPEAAQPLPALLRVDAARLDTIRAEAEALLGTELSLQHQAAELRALAAEIAQQRRAGDVDRPETELRCARLAQAVGATCSALSGTRKRLLGAVLETALVPFSEALDELPALVRKLARGRGREVMLEIDGAAVRIDRRILGVIREALIHLVSNAVDHGIESAPVRLAAGKSASGALQVAVKQCDARHVLVCVSDDGAGFDSVALAGAAGIRPGEFARLGESERIALALRAGVSTQTQVTPVSGRGMGLAIVADKVRAAGGSLQIHSQPGRGSRFELLLPVSLASLRALVVTCGGQRYAVPMAELHAVRLLEAGDIGMVEDRETVVAQGRVLPLLRLASLFGLPAGEGRIALLAEKGARPFALLVDDIVAEQDVLPRGLGPLLLRVRFFSGATELGDGTLVPVLALDDIAAHALLGAQPTPAQADPVRPGVRRVLVAEDSITSRLLLKHILEGAGCEVETAADGLEALSRLRQRRFDAVVSDVEMPHLDGLGLTARIRAEPGTSDLPVILVTSLQTPAERERGLQAGADAYLTKGAFDQDQLLAALRRLT